MSIYFTNDFELTKCGSAANPFLVSWDQTNSVENSAVTCQGSLTNLTFSGGTPPYQFTLTYPDSSSGIGTNFINLCPGTYTANTQDSLLSASTSFITILPLTAGTLTAGVSDNSCSYNINQFCKIEVSGFTHISDNFTYILYKDNNLHEKYEGITGQENYIFNNLVNGSYSLTAYDGLSVSYKSQKTELCTCLNGYTLDSSQVFGYVADLNYTGLSSNNIVQQWRRYNLQNDWSISFGTVQGPHTLPPFNSNPNGIIFESGLDRSGTINVDNPYVWFYTGETSSRKTENTVDWYLGTYALEMEEGDNVGPGTVDMTIAANAGKFYYNTVINKFVMATGVLTNIDAWTTINATANRGQNLYPIATVGAPGGSEITGSSAYKSVSSSPTFEVGYTVTGTTMDAVQWDDVVGGAPLTSVYLGTNTNKPILLVSDCKYLNYVHEVSVGSALNDNDTIGLVLAAFIDTDGLYGPKGTPHHLTLQFNNNSTNGDNVALFYNAQGNSAYSFQEDNRTVVNCGYETAMGCSTIAGVSPITGFSSTILVNPIDNSPFALADYRNQGTTFMRIERSGNLGEKFLIQMTDVITSVDVGTTKNFIEDYEINFNLLDRSTWVGKNRNAQSYAREEDVYKFLGSQSIGYTQASQSETYFYNIAFTGTQSNYLFTSSEFGGSETQQFQLGNPNLQGVESSTNLEGNFYNSLGDGGQIGNPTIPRVRPQPSVQMQTTQIPIMKTSGGTKISAATDTYVLYEPFPTERGKEEPCVEFNFTWTKNTTDLINGNMVPYYSLHPYIPEEKSFSKLPSLTRIFDNPKGRKLIQTTNKQVIGEGVEASDCIKLSQIGQGSEFLIKPNYVFKNKLKELESTPCNSIAPSGTTTGVTNTEVWYDTFDPNPDLKIVGDEDSTGIFSWDSDGKINTREYGLYDSTTDFYFLTTPAPATVNLETNDIRYAADDSCGSLYTQQVEISQYISGGTSPITGTTTIPIVVSGTPFTVTLNFVGSGPLQVTLNGLTLFASHYEDLSDGGDYYFDGTSQVKFRVDTVQANDVINIIYVPGSFSRSYYYNDYIVPAIIPNVSGGTSVTGNTLYTNGYYYYFRTTYAPLGDIGLTLNGTVLSPNSDYTLISNNTVQFGGIQYPDGLTENDIIGQFYFTHFNLLGAAGVKNPQITAIVPSNPYYSFELLLIVRDEIGTIVYTETQISPAQSSNDGIPLMKTFTVQVPTPGTFSYNILTTSLYTLINGDTISNTSTSETYNFSITAAIFYDESNGTTINTITSGGY